MEMTSENIQRLILCISMTLITVLVLVFSADFLTNLQDDPSKRIDTYIKKEDYSKIVEVYNTEIKGTEYEEQYASQITILVKSVSTSWSLESANSEEVINSLANFKDIDNKDISRLANKQIEFILMETTNEQYYSEAKKYIDDKSYIEAIKSLNNINEEASQYANVDDLLIQIKSGIAYSVKSPETVDEYDKSIKLLDECLSLIEDEQLSNRRDELSAELTVLKEVTAIVDKAVKLYDGKKYEESFATLIMGLEEYPDNELLELNLVDFHNHYIIFITKQVGKFCEDEKYDEALNVINEALDEYNCEEFRLLKETVKEEKSFLYKVKNDIVAKFTSATNGWHEEEFDVKQLTNDAGAYVVKSGKKLVLGDYSKDDITVLSYSGNIVAALAGMDFMFDVRDLTYDVLHWGESEYFAFYLAADVVALVPVVGAIKYFSHLKNGTDLVDSVADVSEQHKAISQTVDSIKATRQSADLIDAMLENIESIAKTGNPEKVVKNFSEGYVFKKTLNQGMLGTKHPDTGVEFILQKVKYSNGDMIQGVFPKFKSFSDIQLPKEYYKVSELNQEKYCVEQLQKQTRPIIGKYRKNFTKEQLADIKGGKTPKGFTWHHNEKEGLMQLVDSEIHNKTNHTGGMSLWGLGY